MDKVEKLKEVAISSFWPELVFATIMLMLFCVSIGQPEKMAPVEQENQTSSTRYSIGFDPDVIKHAMALPPGRMLADGKTELAVRSAIELATNNPYDVLSNICSGNVLCAVDEPDEGFKLLKKAVALAPRSRYIRLNLAEKLAEDKRYDDAITQYNLIIDAYPRWTKPHLDLANIYHEIDQPQKEAQELTVVLDADQNNGKLRKQRALALARGGNDRQGLAEYVRGHNDELNFAGLPDDIKLLIKNWGSIDRADYQLRRALENEPDSPGTKYQLARILMYGGQPAQARVLLTEAAKKAPINADIHRNLAIVLQKLGDNTRALAEFRRSIDLEASAARAQREQAGK